MASLASNGIAKVTMSPIYRYIDCGVEWRSTFRALYSTPREPFLALIGMVCFYRFCFNANKSHSDVNWHCIENFQNATPVNAKNNCRMNHPATKHQGTWSFCFLQYGLPILLKNPVTFIYKMRSEFWITAQDTYTWTWPIICCGVTQSLWIIYLFGTRLTLELNLKPAVFTLNEAQVLD